MQVKRRTRKKITSKTSRKTVRRNPSLEQLAKAKMPKWRVVDNLMADDTATPHPDAVSPKLASLQGRGSARSSSRRMLSKVSESVEDSGSSSDKGKRSGLVVMAPTSAEDAKTGTKTQVFEDDEHTGAQG